MENFEKTLNFISISTGIKLLISFFLKLRIINQLAEHINFFLSNSICASNVTEIVHTQLDPAEK